MGVRGTAPAASGNDASARPKVLLTIEEPDTGLPGPAGTLVESLVSGLHDVDFEVWSVGARRFRETAPSNLERQIVVPPWSGPPLDGWGDGSPTGRRTRPSEGEVEGAFVPLVGAFLEATVDPDGPGERLAGILLDLQVAFRRWDPAVVWRSPATWGVVRDHLLVRAHRGESDDGGGEAWTTGDLPSIDEGATALSWLGRMLAATTYDIPRVDLVHATAAGFSALPGVLARAQHGTRLLLSEHAVAPREASLALDGEGVPFHLQRFAGVVSGAVARTVYRLADRIAPATRHTMQWELAYGAPRARMSVVEPGLDDDAFRPARGPRSERPTVVQVSPIRPESDPETLLAVAQRVRAEIPDVMFRHAGPLLDPSAWERVLALRRDGGLEETVVFAGAGADVPATLAQGDVALVTSRSEVLPLAVIESSMCGLPVVATDTGGVREVLDGAGVVAPVGDAEALAEGVAATLRVPSEQRERNRLAVREHAVTRFGLARALRDFRKLYSELGIDVPPAGATGPPPGSDVVVIPEAAERRPDEPPAQATARPRPAGIRTRLSDPDPAVRIDALRALDDAAVADAAAAALADGVARVRREAVRTIGRLDGPRAGRWLAEAVSGDPSPEVRRQAVDALATLVTRRDPHADRG
ncbi:MAG TPA: glycosyltransferase [Actinomycetota bacterium]